MVKKNGDSKKHYYRRRGNGKRRKAYNKYKRKYGTSSSYLLTARPTVAYQPDALPRIMKTAFKYSYYEALSTTSSTTVTSNQTFRLNCPYDPLYATGGSSAQGWGIAMSYYGNYIVLGCMVKVIFSDPSADGMLVGIRFRQNADNSPVGEATDQLQNTQMTYVKNLNNSGSQVVKFKKYVKPWVLSCKDYLYYKNDDNSQAATNAVPSNDKCLLDVFCMNQNASAQALNYRIELTYITLLWNRIAI